MALPYFLSSSAEQDITRNVEYLAQYSIDATTKQLVRPLHADKHAMQDQVAIGSN